jgi:hypothetical protein
LSKIDKEKLKNALSMRELEELIKNKFQLTQFSSMLDWIKNINKELPEFWKTYLSKFDKNRIVMLLFQLKRQA